MVLGQKPEGNICWETSQWGCAAMILPPCSPSLAHSTNLICNTPWYKIIIRKYDTMYHTYLWYIFTLATQEWAVSDLVRSLLK